MTDSVLVIGFGNEQRRDDGAGRRVARLVRTLKWPGVRTLAVHQLTPELAERLAGAGIAVFVDATACSEAVTAQPVTEAPGLATVGHTSDPAWLLGLAEAAYGRRPPAWLVTLPAADISHGTGLSPGAKRAVREALELIEQLTRERRLCMN